MRGETHYDASWRGLGAVGALSVEQVQQSSHVSHDHEFYELVLVESGSAVHELEVGSTPIRRGSAFLIPPGVFHGYSVARNLSIWNVLMLPDSFAAAAQPVQSLAGAKALLRLEPGIRSRPGSTLGEQTLLELSDPAFRTALSYVHAMQTEVTHRRSGWQPMCEGTMTQLLVHLSREFEERNGTRRLIGVARAITEIESRFAERITLADLAATAGMSERTLIRRFQEVTGCSPGRYLIEHRISRARELLETTALPITQISFDVGIPDSSYFSTIFRKETGASPREFRKACRHP